MPSAGAGWGPELGGCGPAVMAVAARARVLADRLRAASATVVPVDDEGWRGPAATAAAALQHDLAARLRHCAAHLDDVAEAAVAHARAAGDRAEELEALARRARELVDRKLRTMPADSPEQRTVAARKLVGMLARKGYGAGTAYGVVREALAAHGAEIDELDGADAPDD